ncbi:MAG TPA: hypothetical protein VG943_05005 [Caulobacterales bacterium]|nr:hypothetical protein [Caulobacterales bacterium]
MRITSLVPVLVLPALLYVALWLIWGADLERRFSGELFSLHMVSGDTWRVTLGAAFSLLSVVCLFVEIVRSGTPTKWTIGENLVTAIALVISLVLFLLVRGFATSEFFFLTVLFLLDFVTDATVMTLTSRRTVEYTH